MNIDDNIALCNIIFDLKVLFISNLYVKLGYGIIAQISGHITLQELIVGDQQGIYLFRHLDGHAVSFQLDIQWQPVSMSGIILFVLVYIFHESVDQSLLADDDTENWRVKVRLDNKEAGRDSVWSGDSLFIAGDNILAEVKHSSNLLRDVWVVWLAVFGRDSIRVPFHLFGRIFDQPHSLIRH